MRFYIREKTDKEKAIPSERITVKALNAEENRDNREWNCWHHKAIFQDDDEVFVTRYETGGIDKVFCPLTRGIFRRPCNTYSLTSAEPSYWDRNYIMRPL